MEIRRKVWGIFPMRTFRCLICLYKQKAEKKIHAQNRSLTNCALD